MAWQSHWLVILAAFGIARQPYRGRVAQAMEQISHKGWNHCLERRFHGEPGGPSC